MYNYQFDAEFVCGLPANNSIINAINSAVASYNSVIRNVYKHLTVSINANGGLTYNLISSIPIASENLLRSCQFFSKELSKEKAMIGYVVPNRMMKR